MAKTVFVTGGAGYVGAHCCKAFAQAGWNVVVYDNLSRGWRDFVKWGPLVEGDILDGQRLANAIKTARPDIVAHFAALAYVGESVTEPSAYYRTNCTGTLNVLDAMRAADVPAIVFSSSCATYGVPLRTPVDETHPQAPISPYGWSKLMAERMILDHGRAHGARSIVLRYFNAAGADPDGEIGERHEPETHVIPLAIRGAMRGDFVFSLYGADYPTRDGTAERDYVHVTDLADAHLRAIAKLSEGAASAIYNLGAERGITVRELIRAVEKDCGRPVRLAEHPRRDGDPPALYASAAKARDELGWAPMRSTIEAIVGDAGRWHDRYVSTGNHRTLPKANDE